MSSRALYLLVASATATRTLSRDSRNGNAVEVPLDGNAIERVNAGSRTGHRVYSALDRARSLQTGDFLGRTESSGWDLPHDLVRWLGNEKAPQSRDIRRVTIQRPRQPASPTNWNGRASVQAIRLVNRRAASPKRPPTDYPPAIRRDIVKNQHRLIGGSPQSGTVRMDAVHKCGVPFFPP